METQFEIHSQLGKKHYVEYYQCILRKNILNVVIFGILGVILFCRWLSSDDYWHLFWGVFSITHAIMVFRLPWKSAAKTLKGEQLFEETELLHSETSFADMVYDKDSYNDARVPYGKIKEIYLSKNTIVLLDVSGCAIIMDKDGFTKGSFGEFLPYIQKKCPQAKIIKR